MLRIDRSSHWTNSVFQIPGSLAFQGKQPDLYLAVMGRFFSDGNFAFEQVSPGYSLHVIESGEGVMEMNGASYSVASGDVFMFFPGCHIRYHDQAETPWRYTWLSIEGKGVRPVLKHLGLSPAHPHVKGDFAMVMSPLFKEIEIEYRKDLIPATFAVASGWRVMDALAQHHSRMVSRQVGVEEMAKTLMDRDDMRALSVGDIARQLKISRSALFRNFRSVYQVSPKTYLESLRINQARRLLMLGRSSIKEIAAACGYANAQYFCRAFRLKCGMTPGRFRKSHGMKMPKPPPGFHF